MSIDIATGAVRWSFRDVDGRRLSRLAVGARHVVVFAGLDVVALDADTGKVTWRVAGETAVSGRPVAVAATVAIPEARGHGTALVGRSLETGIERWRLPLPRFTTVTAGRRAFIAVTSGDSVRVVDPAAGGVVLEVRPGDISVVEAVWTPDALVVAGTRLDGTRLQAYALPAQASLGTGSLVR